jgi:uncharacterized protein (TIGR02452 family)
MGIIEFCDYALWLNDKLSGVFRMNFDHIEWLRKFKTASKNKIGFRELRAEIFHDTLKFVADGVYEVENCKVAISNKNISVNTEFFTHPDKLSAPNGYRTEYVVIEADCLETAELLQKSGFNPCVLNMASRQNPGGGVLGGAGAQEENIFRRTNIFLSLYQFASYAPEYSLEKNENQYPLDKNTGGIYSGGITVFRGSEKNGYRLLQTPFKVSFVSVPAINHPTLEQINGKDYIEKSLIEPTKEKIRTVLRITGKHNHDSLVLSAFGCGAFCNPPHHIAALFREVFSEDEFFSQFKLVVFAIINDHNSWSEHNPEGNVLPFLEVFDLTTPCNFI